MQRLNEVPRPASTPNEGSARALTAFLLTLCSELGGKIHSAMTTELPPTRSTRTHPVESISATPPAGIQPTTQDFDRRPSHRAIRTPRPSRIN